ncbi:MAG: hypothetical protein IKP28_05430 [Clostridia bacterium]|nr:hypothetical protein [Clostridia bacterium]
MKKSKEAMGRNEGITLIALVITVIVLLILAGVAISFSANEEGLFAKTKDSTDKYSYNTELMEKELNKAFSNLISVNIKLTDKDGNSEELTLTKSNFAEHLGKIATDYTGAPTNITIDGKTYVVSNQYRLFWIDFENKYGDGAGTIYLRADCTNNYYSFMNTDTFETVEGNLASSKIRELNPLLYAKEKLIGEEKTLAPSTDNLNMKVAIWLSDTKKWENLKNNVNPNLSDRINYVIGAASVEMYIDSYNTHYGLTDETNSENLNSNRTKLECMYPFNDNNYGYAVSPSSSSVAINGYGYDTDANIIKPDEILNNFYYISDYNGFWLCSPSCGAKGYIIGVSGGDSGWMGKIILIANNAICPLVSLKPDLEM